MQSEEKEPDTINTHEFTDYEYVDENVIDAKDRARFMLNEMGIGVQEFCEKTGYSEGQYYRWITNTGKTSKANSAQFARCCAVFDWSPTYILFGVGPKKISQCTHKTKDQVIADSRRHLDFEATVQDSMALLTENNLILRELMGRKTTSP